MSSEGRPAGRTVDAAGLSLAIAATRWHPEVTGCLVQRAVAAAGACGIAEPLVVRVPGAVELPVVAAELARRHDAVACLGAVIRGGTPHFDYVCDTLAQAIDRCGGEFSSEDKGWDAVLAALETALVLRSLP